MRRRPYSQKVTRHNFEARWPGVKTWVGPSVKVQGRQDKFCEFRGSTYSDRDWAGLSRQLHRVVIAQPGG